jgi:hypothetical protein
MRTDASYKLNFSIAEKIRRAINTLAGKYNQRVGINTAFKHVDFSRADLKRHFESQFRPGMNWSNYGRVWNVDHIRPRNSFSYKSPSDKQFKLCWSLSNLRPLYCSDNYKKGTKLLPLYDPLTGLVEEVDIKQVPFWIFEEAA